MYRIFFLHFSHISVNSIFILVTISTDSFVSSFTALSKLDVLLGFLPQAKPKLFNICQTGNAERFSQNSTAALK